jgi:hypothetical protein
MLQCYKNKKYNNNNSLSAIFCNIDNVTTMLQCYNKNRIRESFLVFLLKICPRSIYL